MNKDSSVCAINRPGLTIRQYKYVLIAPSGYGHQKKIKKVMFKDDIECAYPNVEISLRIFVTLMVTNCSAERSFSQYIKSHKKSEYNQNETRKFGFLISADDCDRFVAEN